MPPFARFDITSHPESGVILEEGEWNLEWRVGWIAIGELAKFVGYLCPQKRMEIQRIATAPEMEQVLRASPPMLFRTAGGAWRLLDGQHRITRCNELAMPAVWCVVADEPAAA